MHEEVGFVLVNDGDAYEVRELEWIEGIETLEVNGTWLGAAKDSELITAKAHMERVHDSLLDKAATLAQLRGEWSDNAVTLQEKLINTGAEARERVGKGAEAVNAAVDLVEAG